MSQHSARDRRWMNLRRQKLIATPVCEHDGCTAPATTVDHVQPQSTHPHLRYDFSNLRSLCHRHHLHRHGKRPRPTVDPRTGLPTSGH
jgi:5-methylcytosine-specific restriction endonuclease McrA